VPAALSRPVPKETRMRPMFGSLLLRRSAPLALALVAVASGCGRSGSPGAPAARGGGGGLVVVAAENFWGSIAAQLGGGRPSVSSIIVNPDTDPHAYEPNARDARALAGAQLVIVNGLGYDAWADRLLAASPLSGRLVLNVGRALELGAGANPHQWYSPAHVQQIVDRISAAYERLDPADTSYFAQRRVTFLTAGLARYQALRREIRAEFAGAPVGYSESIFQPLDRRGHRRDRAGQAARRHAGLSAPDQGLDLQQPERHPRRAAGQCACARTQHPHRDRDRDAGAGFGELRAVAGGAARSAARRAAQGDGTVRPLQSSRDPDHATVWLGRAGGAGAD